MKQRSSYQTLVVAAVRRSVLGREKAGSAEVTLAQFGHMIPHIPIFTELRGLSEYGDKIENVIFYIGWDEE